MSTVVKNARRIGGWSNENLVNHIIEQHQKLLDLAALSGCTLNGLPARLEAPSPNARHPLFRVKTLDGTDGTVVSEASVNIALKWAKGQFLTKPTRQFACV